MLSEWHPTLARLCAAMGGRPVQGRLSGRFAGAQIDTRSMKAGQVFFAMRGSRTDGHRFIGQARRAGASAAVVQRRVSGPASFPIIRVASTVRALQRGAAWYRGLFHLPVVGITGSNGKTTAKDMTAWLLKGTIRGRITATEGNLNNHLGLPLSVFRLGPGARAAVFELAMNRPGEIRMLARIAAPGIGVLLNAGPAHLWRFKSVAGVLREKASLIACLPAGGWAVINADDRAVWEKRRSTPARAVGFGIGRGDFRAENVTLDSGGRARFRLCTPSGSVPTRICLPGRHNVSNALAASAVAWILGAAPAAIAADLARYRPHSSLRLERVRLKGGALGIADCYNANPDSFRAAFAHVKAIGARKPVLVMGEMLELGAHSAREHRRIGLAAAALKPGFLLGVGPKAKETVKAARKAGVRETDWVRDIAQVPARLSGRLRAGGVALFKASRKVEMEKVLRGMVSRGDRKGERNAV